EQRVGLEIRDQLGLETIEDMPDELWLTRPAVLRVRHPFTGAAKLRRDHLFVGDRNQIRLGEPAHDVHRLRVHTEGVEHEGFGVLLERVVKRYPLHEVVTVEKRAEVACGHDLQALCCTSARTRRATRRANGRGPAPLVPKPST